MIASSRSSETNLQPALWLDRGGPGTQAATALCHRPSDVMIYLFQSEADQAVFAFTQDSTGRNLPPKFAPWKNSKQGGSLYLGVGESSAQLGPGDPVLRAVETQGYYLVAAPSRSPMRSWKR
jgi:hypothetical protein